jgi:hypothetical protein
MVRGAVMGNAQNYSGGYNPVLINDDEDNTVYEQEEFEPVEVHQSYVSNVQNAQAQ